METKELIFKTWQLMVTQLKGKTYKDLAKICNLPYTTLIHYSNGDRTPNMKNYNKIWNVYKTYTERQ